MPGSRIHCRPFAHRAALLVCLGLFIGIFTTSARAELPETSQRIRLKADLDIHTHTLRGSERIQFQNTSSKVLHELVFHLYMNAFRDRDSVFMRESGGQLRGEHFEGTGSIELSSLRVDGVDVLRGAVRELIPKDRTQLKVTLPTPVPPGRTVIIDSTFVTRLPKVFARSGYAGDFHMVGQWFPKLAKLEPDGTFASFPYHALSEFYADFADYELEVITEAGVTVGATGKLVDESKVGTKIAQRFEASAVHDVAFVASPSLRTRLTHIDGVDITYYFPPGYELALAEHEKMVVLGLKHFGRRFGAYPYKNLSVVIPPRGASGAAGMEYPMLFVTEGSWLGFPRFPGLSGVFVTAHELAHQWFQGVIASNEARYPFLDEGLTEWASIDVLRAAWGAADSVASGLPLSRFELERLAAVAHAPPAVPASWPASAYSDGEYGRLIYARTAIALETLRRAHGRDRFDRALSLYAKRMRFGHPSPRDLAQAFDDTYGPGFAAKTLTPLLFEGQTSAVHFASVRSEQRDKRHATEVRARRTGRVQLPTWIAAFSADGNELARVPFPVGSERLDHTFVTTQAVARVEIDPDRALLVDSDTRDQVRVLIEPERPRFFQILSSWFSALFAAVGP